MKITTTWTMVLFTLCAAHVTSAQNDARTLFKSADSLDAKLGQVNLSNIVKVNNDLRLKMQLTQKSDKIYLLNTEGMYFANKGDTIRMHDQKKLFVIYPSSVISHIVSAKYQGPNNLRNLHFHIGGISVINFLKDATYPLTKLTAINKDDVIGTKEIKVRQVSYSNEKGTIKMTLRFENNTKNDIIVLNPNEIMLQLDSKQEIVAPAQQQIQVLLPRASTELTFEFTVKTDKKQKTPIEGNWTIELGTVAIRTEIVPLKEEILVFPLEIDEDEASN